MGAVQNVGPFFNFGNVKVVKTDSDYSLNKDDGELIVNSPGNIVNCTLPPNPEAGETHRIMAAAGTHAYVFPNAGQQIRYNPEGTGFLLSPTTTCVVPEGTVVDFAWNDANQAWVASCCAQELT